MKRLSAALLAFTAFGASPALAQLDPAARGLAAQAQSTASGAASTASANATTLANIQSGAAPVPPPLSHPGAAYALMQKVMRGNATSGILINSDSTGVSAHSNGTPYWPYQVAQWIGQQNPKNSVYYYTASGSGYAAPVTIQQGTGSGRVYVYNAAVSGTQEWYWYGQYFNNMFGQGSLAVVPDLIVVNHDKNHDYTEGAGALTGMKEAAVGWLSSKYPQAGVIVTEENPDPINYNYAVSAVWQAGMPVTSGEIVQSGPGAYTAGAAGTAGTTPPLCTAGTCSDGSITWTYNGVGQQMDAKVQATAQAASLMNWEVVDNYDLFWNNGNGYLNNLGCLLTAGNPLSCFDYTVHQSNAMNLQMAQNFEQHLLNLNGPMQPNQSLTQIGVNLLTNGTFQTMSSSTACPTNWTCSNATLSQVTSGTPMNGGTYQLQLSNTAAGASTLTQSLSAAALNSVLGSWVHLTGFVQFINQADIQSCSIQVTSNGGRNTRNYGMSATGNYVGRVFPFSINAYVAPTDTSVVATLYGTFQPGTAAGNGCIFDHVVLAPGQVPTDGR